MNFIVSVLNFLSSSDFTQLLRTYSPPPKTTENAFAPTPIYVSIPSLKPITFPCTRTICCTNSALASSRISCAATTAFNIIVFCNTYALVLCFIPNFPVMRMTCLSAFFRFDDNRSNFGDAFLNLKVELLCWRTENLSTLAWWFLEIVTILAHAFDFEVTPEHETGALFWNATGMFGWPFFC